MPDKTLFVLGNGFDLAHDLPTKYEHFFCFIKTIQVYISTGVILNTNEYNKVYSEICHYLQNVLPTDQRPPYIDAIINTLHLQTPDYLNLWHTYFSYRLSQNPPGVTWIDFEKAIQDVIKRIRTRRTGVGYLSLVSEEMHGKVDAFSPELQQIHNDLVAINSTEGRYPSFAFRECSDLLVNKTASFLHQQLLEYAFCFELYLRFYVLDSCQHFERLDFFDSLFSKFPLGKNFVNLSLNGTSFPDLREVFALSFNYTNTLELIYNQTKNVHHIHGKIRSAEELETLLSEPNALRHAPIVLGFHNDNEAELQDASPFLWFEKFYQRILYKTGTDTYSWISQQKLGSLTSIFYGHSLDVTDKDLIIQIFDASYRVIIYYHDETVVPGLLSNLIRIFGKDTVESIYSNGKLVFTFAG